MSSFRWSVCAIASAMLFLISGSAADDSEAILARGEYMIKAMDCGACHTPWKIGPKGPQPDAERLLSGHPDGSELPAPPSLPPGPWNVVTAGNTAWAGPWGVSYATNLTPDEETGMGAWTEKMFADSMRNGTHLGMGRDILPPMPRHPELTDEDLRAMFKYLMSIPAIKNQVPEPEPPQTAP